MGSKVVSTSSSDSWLINRDNSSVGVSNKASIRSIASSIGDWSSSGINSTINSLGSKMVSTCSSNSRFLNNKKTSDSHNLRSREVEDKLDRLGLLWEFSAILLVLRGITTSSKSMYKFKC